MAGPSSNEEFMNGLMLGLLISGALNEEGLEAEEAEFFIRERLGELATRWPFPLRFRPRRRLAGLEARVAKIERQSERVAASMGTFAWALSVGARPDDMDQLVALPVRVYLEVAGHFPHGLVEAAKRFVTELGFDVVATGEPEDGSFRQRFVSMLRGFFSKAETQAALDKGARALELQVLDGPQAEVTNVLAGAASKLMEQVKDQKGPVCLQVGSLLLVRYRPERKKEFVTSVRTLSPMQLRRLEENQAQLDDPNTILQWLRASETGRLSSPE